MSYRLGPQAENDVAAIADYIASESPRSAAAFIERLRRRWRLLALNPYSGPSRDDVSPGLRHVVVDAYLVLYRIQPDHIEILRVLHGRRDLRDVEGLGVRQP